MKKKALLVSSANPYPTVTSGCERLIIDYQSHLLSDYDVYFLLTSRPGWAPVGLYHQDELITGDVTIDKVLDHDFEFALFIGFIENEFTRRLVDRIPSFCLTDIHPRDDLPDKLFKGIMAHRSTDLRADVRL